MEKEEQYYKEQRKVENKVYEEKKGYCRYHLHLISVENIFQYLETKEMMF